MTVPYKQVLETIKEQLPTIAEGFITNAGVGYNVDPDLTGEARFFKKLAGVTNLLALHCSYIVDMAVAAGRSAIMFRGFFPEKGYILTYRDVQYEVINRDGDITYLDPVMQEPLVEGSVFRLSAVPINIVGQISASSLDIESSFSLVVGDTLQIDSKTYRILEAKLEANSRWSVAVDQELVLNYDSSIPNFLIVNPAYISEKINIIGRLAPFDLALPISTQFQEDFTLTLKLDLMSQEKVIKSYTKSTSSTLPLRFSVFEVPVPHTSLVCMNRLSGRMDYNGSAVGICDKAVVEWRDEFPMDQINRWQVRVEAESEGKLVVHMDDYNPTQVFELKAGQNTIAIKGFKEQDKSVRNLRFVWVATGPIHPKYRTQEEAQLSTLWIRELVPDTLATHIRYTILFESTNLFRSDHLLLCGPKAQPSLPDISVCYADPTRLDAGFLLKRQ